ncbi:MAG: VWA domain-containing protein [Pirellulaceae bacterium]|nr:VWA domain-containing protein [Pirellulaceae bacterium]
MTFAFPWILVLLPLALLALHRRPRAAIAVPGLAVWRNVPPSRRLRWLRRVRLLVAMAIALLIAACADPQIERQVGEETRQGIAIQLLIDISSSMDQSLAAEDGARVSRLEAAKQVVEQFIRHRPDDMLGVITFARYADTLSPLTFGHEALLEIVRGLAIQQRATEDGTGYGDALALACARLDHMGQWQPAAESRTADPAAAIRSKVVVLLTDGENNCGLHLPEEAAGLAKKWGIRVYAVSLKDDERDGTGSDQKADDAGLTDAERLLRRLADETEGAYWKIGNATQLEEVYERINQLETSEIKTTILYHTEIRPLFHYLAIAAFALLLIEQILCATWLRVAEEVER